VCGAQPQRLALTLAGSSDVLAGYRREWDELDRVDLDLAEPDAGGARATLASCSPSAPSESAMVGVCISTASPIPSANSAATRGTMRQADSYAANRFNSASTDRVPAPALVLGGIASVQLGAAFATKLFVHLGPAGTVLVRVLFAAVVLCAIWRPSLRRHTASELRLAMLFGLSLAFMNLTFYEALDRIHLGIAVTLEFVGPLAVSLAGSRSRRDVVWALLAAAGVALLGGFGAPDALGAVFALVAGAFWGAYILLNARVGRTFSGGAGLAIAMAIGTVPLIPFGIADAGTRLLHPAFLAVGFAVAMLSSVVPYSLELEALRRIRPQVFGVLMSLEPAMAALAGLLVVGQGLSVVDAAAIALVVTASAGATLGSRRPVAVDA
jgi:inner membrane transporter RhtA